MKYIKFTSGVIYPIENPSEDYLSKAYESGAVLLPDGSPDIVSYLAAKSAAKDQANAEAKQAEALKAYSDLTPLFVAVQAKGYPTLADAMLLLVAALPDYVPSGA